MTEDQKAILAELQQALDGAKKSKRGFVNWRTAGPMRNNFRIALVNLGMTPSEAQAAVAKIADPYDTHYSKGITA